MNITQEKVDDLNAILKVNIEKPDYEERVQNILKDYRKKANIKGFRPGKVPMGLINKMYRVPVLVDEINKLVSEELGEYIQKEELKILGEPLPSEKEQPEFDWSTQENFEFAFDIGLTPEFDVKFSKKDKIPYYNIEVSDEMLNTYKDSYLRRYGNFEETDTIEEGTELVKGMLVQLNEDGSILEGGIMAEESTISTEHIKDEAIKNEFTGKKVGETIDFDIKKALPNDSEISSLLKIKKDEVADLSPLFRLTINEIKQFKKAELNQELFDQVYGEGEVKSEEEFEQKIKEEIAFNLRQESEYKFSQDVRDMLVDKVKMDLPTEFLKRWLKAANKKEEVSDEQLEKEFPMFEKDLRWQLIKNKIGREHEIKVEEADIIDMAKSMAKAQYAQYGITNVPEEHLESYAKKMLENQQEARNLAERAFQDKVVEHLKNEVKLDEKNISMDNFRKLFEE